MSEKLIRHSFAPRFNYCIDAFIKHEHNADIFSVSCPDTNEVARQLEARAYAVDNVPQKLRRLRFKNMNRVKKHALLESKVEGLWVLLCPVQISVEEKNKRTAGFPIVSSLAETSDQSEVGPSDIDSYPQPKLDMIPVAGASFPEPSSCSDLPKFYNKSPRKVRTVYQQESRRMRQKDRRAAKRQDIARQKQHLLRTVKDGQQSDATAKDNLEQRTTDRNDWSDQDNQGLGRTFTLLLFIYYAYDTKGLLRDAGSLTSLPGFRAMAGSPVAETLLQYVTVRVLDFRDEDEMKAYLGCRQSEIISLSRLQKQMPQIDRYYHDKFKQVLETTNTRLMPEESSGNQKQAIAEARHQLIVTRGVRDILPAVKQRSEEVCRQLKEKLSQLHVAKEQRDARQGLADKRDALSRRRHALAMWHSTVVPGSSTHSHIARQYRDAEKNLLELMNEDRTVDLEDIESGCNKLMRISLD